MDALSRYWIDRLNFGVGVKASATMLMYVMLKICEQVLVLVHRLLAQSIFFVQVWLPVHGAQSMPPQFRPVSPLSVLMSKQCGGYVTGVGYAQAAPAAPAA